MKHDMLSDIVARAMSAASGLPDVETNPKIRECNDSVAGDVQIDGIMELAARTRVNSKVLAAQVMRGMRKHPMCEKIVSHMEIQGPGYIVCTWKKYQCPCCGHHTLPEQGAYEICGVCGWEDCGITASHLDVHSEPNHMTLREGQRRWAKRLKD